MDKDIPQEVRDWSWGAFFLTWIWGIGNGVWISLLALIPVVNIVMMFVLGAKGNELAWKARHWESEDSFLNIQKKWAIVGLIIWIVGFLLLVILLSSGVFIKQYDDYKYASDATTVVENFQEIITQAEAAIAAAGAGQTTPLSMPHKLPEGANIMISSLSIDPNTSSVTVILKPSTKSSINNVTAQSLRRYGMVGCGESGGCVATINSNGAVKYSTYKTNSNKEYPTPSLQSSSITSKHNQESNDIGMSHVEISENSAHIHYYKSYPQTTAINIGPLGILQINTKGTGIDAGGQSVNVHGNYNPLSFYATVADNNNYYYVVRSLSGGTACPAQFMVVYIDANGNFKATRQFGTCSAETKISVASNKISFNMYTQGGEKKTYSFNMSKDPIGSSPDSSASNMSSDSELKAKLTHETHILDYAYNQLMNESSASQDQQIKHDEIQWIIKKRAACGTYANDLLPGNKAGLECQISGTKKRIKAINSILSKNDN